MIETDYPINNLVRIIAILLISLRRRRGGECVTQAIRLHLTKVCLVMQCQSTS